MTKRRKHTHQYHRTYPSGLSFGILKSRGQWECALPTCTHFLPKNMSEPIGKMSLCNGCMAEFVLDEENMKFDKPVCATCANPITEGAALDDLMLERHMIKSTIATRTGRALEEVSETEVDRHIQYSKLKDF